MHYRWNMLSFLLSLSVVVAFGCYPRAPVWVMVVQGIVQTANANVEGGEWRTLVCNSQKEYWVEWRQGLDMEPVRQLLLEMPKLKGEKQFLVSKTGLSAETPLVVADSRSKPQAGGAKTITIQYWLFDSESGRLLGAEPIEPHGMSPFAQQGKRLAIAEIDQLHLIDGKCEQVRQLPLRGVGNLTFSPDGRWLALTDANANLQFLDWTTAKLTQPVGFSKKVYSLQFLTNETIVMSIPGSQDHEIQRWKWNGTALSSISPGVKLPTNQWPMMCKLSDDGLHVNVYTNISWPKLLRPLCQWLIQHQFPVERWVSRTMRSDWHILDDQDRVVGEYGEPVYGEWARIDNEHAVECQVDANKSTTTMIMWNVSPMWPNALACGVVVYLGLYVMGKCVGQRKMAR